MSLISADMAVLSLVSAGGAVAGLTKHTLRLNRPLTDRTGRSDWAERGADQRPAEAELRAEGTFLSGAAQTALRSLFLAGSSDECTLDLPGEGSWQGRFFVRELTFRGEAEGEERFFLRLSSTGPVTFQATQQGGAS
jgi:predicted secreted protein